MRGMRSPAVRDRLYRVASAGRGAELDIVSYDAGGADKSVSVAIANFIFGRTLRADGGLKEYRYPGVIEKPGVAWIGQSVFLVTQVRSKELRSFLDRKGVAYARIRVRVV